jgi:oligopeptidase B
VAYAHVRGGGERGPEWHAAGSKNNRLNSVLDLQSCIQFLIAEKLTSPEVTCAVAASAGGVVLGSALNLFGKSLIGGAAILRVPFVNLLNTLKDPSLPLSSHEKDEWGDPNDPTDASFIQSASPIDNLVSDVPEWYPPMLVTCSEDDARVPFEGVVEYAKKLRTITQSRDRLVVKTNRAGEGGHFGSASTAGSYEDTCVELAFLIQSLEDSHQP